MNLTKTFSISTDTSYDDPIELHLPVFVDYVSGEILQVVARVASGSPTDGDIIISYKEDDSTNLESFVYQYEGLSFPFVDTLTAPFAVQKEDGLNRLFIFAKTDAAAEIVVRVDYRVSLSKMTGL